MDQMPRNNDGNFAHNGMFANSQQQYNAYDPHLFQTGADQTSYEASWGVNASNYQDPSRAQRTHAPSWPQNANQLSAPAHPSPYARSLPQSPAQFDPNAFNNYGAQQHFQYRQPPYDPNLIPPHAFNQNFSAYSSANYSNPNAGTIAPHALENETRSPAFGRNPHDGQDYAMANSRSARQFPPETVDQKALATAIPNGGAAGYFSIINFDDLAKATKSERMGNFVNIGSEPRNYDLNRAALPTYVPRKSRNELRKLAGNDARLHAKLGKKIVKKEKPVSKMARPLQTSTTAVSSPGAEKVKYEGDSSSEEDSSSDEDDDSDTSDDLTEPSPLPIKRPETPNGATEYDTIKALWRSKRKQPDSQSIRKGLIDFWQIVKTIRDRWKADTTAVTEAESKNRANELPLLKSRVKDQRDMMETAFKAALKHGHRDIIELFSENSSLIFLCYQFLLDRVKSDDYNSPLPRAMLETLTICTTLTEEKLEKTHLGKVLPRFAKNGDAKTQFYAKRVISNAASATKEKSTEAVAKKPATKDSNPGSPTNQRAEPERVAGVKRPGGALGDETAQKKVATAATKQNGAVKKPAASSDGTKPAMSTAAAAVKPKQVVAKPSGLFSSLQSAAKKPGTSNANKATQSTTASATSKPAEKSATQATASAAPKSTFSFAETMANLSKPKEEKPAVKKEKQEPPETPEEKAKRLRKESRRHLHVQFKTGEDLVQVRVFHHDPDEDLGHDASQMRDVSDVGGEGRMFKQQHQMMDVDDEEEEDEKLIDFSTPSEIDFVEVDPEERKRNYAPYGGGELEPESAERAVREHYEANNLMVFYTDVNDIPPNPKEPSDPYNGEALGPVRKFGTPEEKYAARVKQRNGSHAQQHNAGQQPSMAKGTTPAFDMSQISNFMNNQQFPPSNAGQPPQQQQQPPSNDAISNILAALKQNQPSQSIAPAMGSYANQYPTAAPTQQAAVQPPPGQPDLAAILAQISQNPAAATQPPPMGGFGFNTQAAAPNFQPQQAAAYENPERKQWREGGTGGSTNFMARDKRQNPAANPWYKTKVCKYWQENRCQKGDQCTYKHEEA